MSKVPLIELPDGAQSPQLAFGVFQIPPEETADAVKTALQIGYRHIDTAEMYPNERGVGQGIPDAGLDRAELYITSKLNNGCHRPDDARRAFDDTLMALSTDYVDLFPIHWPVPTPYDGDFVSTWQTLEGFKNDGRARSIGVSNFQIEHTCSGSCRRPTPPRRSTRSRCTRTSPTTSSASMAPTTASRPSGHPSRKPRCPATRWCDDRRGDGQDTGPSGAALAHPARRHRLPEISYTPARAGELRAVRLRTHGFRHRRVDRAG